MQKPVSLDHNGKEGAALFLLDPKDGGVIRVFDGSDLAHANPESRAGGGVTGPAPYMGMMVSEPTLLRSNSSAYMTGQILTADNRGNIFRVRMESESGAPLKPEDWTIETAATLQKEADIDKSTASYALSGGMAAGSDGADGWQNMWIAGGTADVPAPVVDGEGVIKNEKQMIFSFKMGESLQVRDKDWKELKASSETNDDPTLALGAADGKSGWYIPLFDPPEPNQKKLMPEYVTTKPVLYNGILFIGTFLGQKLDVSESDKLCVTGSVTGKSRLYAIDMRTGGARLWSEGAKYIELTGVKIAGLTLSEKGKRRNLLATYTNLPGGDEDPTSEISEMDKKRIESFNFGSSNNGSDGVSVTLEDGDNVIPPGTSLLIYWLTR
jgi:Tfp pilus tip-associated adhesin PilY1